MRETAGKQEMGKIRRNEYCVSLLEVEGVSPFSSIRFSGGFWNRVYDFIIIIMPRSGHYGLALFNELSDLESLLYEHVLRYECILYFWSKQIM